MAIVECIPNVSEGRRPEVIDACARAIREAGAALLDSSADPIDHRSVYTFAGDASTVATAVLALFETAIGSVDLRHHTGQHPRIGAVDVVPLVPLGGTPMAECVALSRTLAREVAERHDLPVFLYGAAAERPGRASLEDIRRGGFEKLGEKLLQPEWVPDFGPRRPHWSAGASVIGARRPLIAYNVNLATTRFDVAAQVARAVRQSSGGLPSVKAMAVELADRGAVQVSMNLTDFEQTSMEQAFQAVADHAARFGVDVLESELIGLAPAAALSRAIAKTVRLRDFSERQILENRLRDAGVKVS